MCSNCSSSYKYTCSGTNIAGGSGTACGGKYTACTCKSPYTWSSGSCICSSAYKYTCSGTGYSGGSGTACNGKYKSCTCSSGYEWDSGACMIPPKVGDILYSDMTWSSRREGGKTPIGVVAYISGSKRFALALSDSGGRWSDTSDFTDIPQVTTAKSESSAKADYNGRGNTMWIVNTLVDAQFVAHRCYNYTTAGTSKGDWYLPAAGELYSAFLNMDALYNGFQWVGGKMLEDTWYWSSTEFYGDGAWAVWPKLGYRQCILGSYAKNANHFARCAILF